MGRSHPLSPSGTAQRRSCQQVRRPTIATRLHPQLACRSLRVGVTAASIALLRTTIKCITHANKVIVPCRRNTTLPRPYIRTSVPWLHKIRQSIKDATSAAPAMHSAAGYPEPSLKTLDAAVHEGSRRTAMDGMEAKLLLRAGLQC